MFYWFEPNCVEKHGNMGSVEGDRAEQPNNEQKLTLELNEPHDGEHVTGQK